MAILTSIIKKEALHIVRDRRTMFITLLMPLVLLLLFGFAISTEVNLVRVAVSAERPDALTRDIAARLAANEYFEFRGMVTPTQVEPTLRRGEADAVLVMRNDHGRPEAQIIVDASNPTAGQAATAYIGSLLGGNGGGGEGPITVETLYNPQMKSSYNFVPGIMGMIFILICAIMTSVSIVSEKESGSMDLLLVSPARAWTVIVGKLVPYFMLSCIILGIMLTMAYTVLGIPQSATTLWVIGLSLIYVVLSLSIGLLVSTLVSTRLSALLVSAVIFMLPVIMLSGMIFPVDNMPRVLQWLSCAIPARWYIAAMRKLMIQQLEFSYVAAEAGVLLGMTALILTLAIKKFKTR